VFLTFIREPLQPVFFQSSLADFAIKNSGYFQRVFLRTFSLLFFYSSPFPSNRKRVGGEGFSGSKIIKKMISLYSLYIAATKTPKINTPCTAETRLIPLIYDLAHPASQPMLKHYRLILEFSVSFLQSHIA
jgi:hypothetical protein